MTEHQPHTPDPDTEMFARLERELSENSAFEELLRGLVEATADSARLDEDATMSVLSELDRERMEENYEIIGAYAGNIDRLRSLSSSYLDQPHLLVSVLEDIRRLQSEFLERYQQVIAADLSDELGELEAYTLVHSLSERIVPTLERLAISDIVQVRAPAVIIDLCGDMIGLPEEMQLYGRFTGLSLGGAPDMMTVITGEPSGIEDLAIALVLENPIIADPETGDITGEAGPIVHIPLHDILPGVHKIVY